ESPKPAEVAARLEREREAAEADAAREAARKAILGTAEQKADAATSDDDRFVVRQTLALPAVQALRAKLISVGGSGADVSEGYVLSMLCQRRERRAADAAEQAVLAQAERKVRAGSTPEQAVKKALYETPEGMELISKSAAAGQVATVSDLAAKLEVRRRFPEAVAKADVLRAQVEGGFLAVNAVTSADAYEAVKAVAAVYEAELAPLLELFRGLGSR